MKEKSQLLKVTLLSLAGCSQAPPSACARVSGALQRLWVHSAQNDQEPPGTCGKREGPSCVAALGCERFLQHTCLLWTFEMRCLSPLLLFGEDGTDQQKSPLLHLLMNFFLYDSPKASTSQSIALSSRLPK